MKLEVPMRTRGSMNLREHYQERARRVRGEKFAVGWALATVKDKPAPPLRVTLTRIGPTQGLDDDNLASALKSVRDAFASWIGVDDRHRDVVRYCYEQRRAPLWAVEIAVEPYSSGSAMT